MGKRECLKSIGIGQSAAKLRGEERSETRAQARTAMLSKYCGKRWASIYTLQDSKGNIRYVGQTVRTLKERLSGHICDAQRKNNYLQNWIKKENLSVSIHFVKDYPIDLITAAEYYWIKYYMTLGYKLTNCRVPVKPGMLGFNHTEEVKRRISDNSKKPKAEATKLKIAEANFKSCVATKDGIDYHFPSIQEGCRILNTSPNNVSRCFKNPK